MWLNKDDCTLRDNINRDAMMFAAIVKEDAEAQYGVALSFQESHEGSVASPAELSHFFSIALKNGFLPLGKNVDLNTLHPEVLFMLGLGCQDRPSIKNHLKSFQCFRLAVAKGHPKATFHLSEMYRTGLGGVTIDIDKANKLLHLATERGYEMPVSATQAQEKMQAKIAHLEQKTLSQQVTKQKSKEIMNENTKKILKEPQCFHKQKNIDAESNKKRETYANITAQEKPRANFKEFLLVIITGMEKQMKPTCEKFLQDTHDTSFEFLKKDALDKIQVGTAKLEKPLMKNKERLPKLKLILSSLEKLQALHDKIKITEVRNEMENILQLSKGFQGLGLGGKLLTENEKKILEEKYPEFMETCKYLNGKMDDASEVFLNKALMDLKTQWSAFNEKYVTLVDCMKGLGKLNEEVSTRTKIISAYRTPERGSAENEGLKSGELDEIRQVVQTLQEKMIQLKVDTTALPVSVTAGPLQESFALPQTVVNIWTEGVFQSRFAPGLFDIMEGTLPVEPVQEKISKEKRIAQYKQKCADAREKLRREEEAAAIRDRLSKTEEDSLAGKLRVLEKGKSDLKTPVIQNEQLKEPLDQLKSIIDICKPDVSKQDMQWTQKKVFALFLSLGQVSECFAQEMRKEDPVIARVSRRFRNATFKNFDQIQKVVGGLEPLLTMANAWYIFLQNEHAGYFQTDLGVLNSVGSESFKEVYKLGKILDARTKDENDVLKQSVDYIDIAKSRQTIRNMKAYWVTRIREKQRQKENLSEIQKVINATADKFCLAIMGSEIAALDEAKKQNKKGASAALREFQELKPFLSQIREMGACERHAEKYVEEQDESVRVLLAIESIDEPLCVAAKGLDKPLILSQSIAGYDTQDAKKAQEEDSIKILFKALDMGVYRNEYLQELLLKVNVNAEESSGRTLLLAACQNVKTPHAFIKALLEQGADPNNAMCVTFVAENGRKDIIQLFLKNQIKPVKSEIWDEVKSMYSHFAGAGSESALIKLLEAGEKSSRTPSFSKKLV